jgi:hypothetical protein
VTFHFGENLIHYGMVISLGVSFFPQLLGEYVTILLIILGHQTLLRVETRILLLFHYFSPELLRSWIVYLSEASIPKDKFIVNVIDKVALSQS